MTTLRLGHTLENIHPNLHNGPGWRISLWTQGCVHRCTQTCLNPHYLDPKAGHLIDVEDIVERIKQEVSRSFNPIEGITLLGGEPLEQAASCSELLTEIKALGLSTMVYSGFTYEHLLKNQSQAVQHCLKVIDLLIDGPYLPKFYDPHLAWRGSSNQRLICLSECYTPETLEEAFQKQGKSYSIQVKNGHLTVSGFQETTSKF